MTPRLIVSSLLLLSGCAGSDTILVQDDDNFAYPAEIEEKAVKSDTTITIDWSGLSLNLYGDLIEALVDLDTAELLAFPILSVEEVADGLANDTLVQSDLGAGFGFHAVYDSLY